MNPIRLRAAPDFDLAEWTELYRTDPAAAEARRASLVVIELARASGAAGPAAAYLKALAASEPGGQSAARELLAAQAIDASARTMNRHFTDLESQLRRIAAGPTRDA